MPTLLAYKLAHDYIGLFGWQRALDMAEGLAGSAGTNPRIKPIWTDIAQAIKHLDRRPQFRGSNV